MPAETMPQTTLLGLTVNNHPGVMSHVCGLFARRAYNVEGILCLPIEDGRRSRIWLRVAEQERLPQVIRQLEKLLDVLQVDCNPPPCADMAGAMAYFQGNK